MASWGWVVGTLYTGGGQKYKGMKRKRSDEERFVHPDELKRMHEEVVDAGVYHALMRPYALFSGSTCCDLSGQVSSRKSDRLGKQLDRREVELASEKSNEWFRGTGLKA